jgi:putative ABC transport system permease protein
LIGAIILFVIVATVVALIITNTSNEIINDYKDRFGSEVRIEPDMEALQAQAAEENTGEEDGGPRFFRMEIPTIDPDQYIAFGDSDYLQKSEYLATAGLNSTSITAIDAELGGGGGRMMMLAGRAGGGPGGQGGFDSGTENVDEGTSFMYNLSAGDYSAFDDGSRELAEGGSMPEEMNECIISTELAELNGIEVGDTIHFTGVLNRQKEDEVEDGSLPEFEEQETAYDLKVVGIYYDATDEYADSRMQNAYTNSRNEIITNVDTVVGGMVDGWDGISVSATYYLKDPDMLEDFAAEVKGKGLDELFEVTTDSQSYDSVVKPVEGMKKIALTFMIAVLVLGGIIVALLSSIAVRERKYEIGVMRAMGLKKIKVGFGLWAETVIITLLCIVVGLGIGVLAAQPVADALLDTQVEALSGVQDGRPQMGTFGGGGPQMTTISRGGAERVDVEALTDVDVSLDFVTMLEIIGIALLLVSLASIIAISRINRYEPIKILMERN